MASCDFKKLHTVQEVIAMLIHAEKESRKKKNHANKQIDSSLTEKNWQTVKSREEAFQIYQDRIAELDATTNTNFRKDRVTCFGVEIPAPLGLKEEDQKEFFESCIQILKDKYGEKNFIGGFVHVDEVHKYVDAVDGKTKTSRAHLHTYIVPEINGKLIGKKFSSKSGMQSLNREIDLMSRKRFGLAFMDGSKQKSTMEVEELKKKSVARQLKQIEEMQIEADRELHRIEKIRIQLEEEDLKIEEEKKRIKEEWAKIRQAKRDNHKEERALQDQRKQLDADAKEMDKEWDALDSEWKFLDQLKETAQKILAQARKLLQELFKLKEDLGAKIEWVDSMDPSSSALQFMQRVKFKNGDTVYDRYMQFREKEQQERGVALNESGGMIDSAEGSLRVLINRLNQLTQTIKEANEPDDGDPGFEM